MTCECIIDSDCSKNCGCVDSVCYPPDLKRDKNIVTKTKTKIIGIVFGIIILISGFIFLKLRHSYSSTHIHIIYYILFSIPLLYSVISSFIKFNEREFKKGDCK